MEPNETSVSSYGTANLAVAQKSGRRRGCSCALSALIVFAISLAPMALAQVGSNTDEAPPAIAVPLEDLTRAIQDALSDARRYNDQPPYFLVKRILLNLKVVKRQEGEGGVKFEVPILPVKVSVEGGGDIETADELNMELKPAPQTLVGAAEQINLSGLVSEVKAALAASGGLDLIKFEYKTTFQLQAKIGGGIDVAVVEGSVEVSKVTSQRVEFQLCQTVDLLDCVE